MVMTVLPPPALDCASCAARDAVIAEQARVLQKQAAAIEELRSDVVALAAQVKVSGSKTTPAASL